MSKIQIGEFAKIRNKLFFPAPKNVYFSKEMTLEAGTLCQIEYVFEYAAPGWALCKFEDSLKRPIWLEIELTNLITNKKNAKTKEMVARS